jgi:hypothetical protein
MYKETKKLYEAIEKFQKENPEFSNIAWYRISEERKQDVFQFWKEFIKENSKKSFYKMVSDPHWKYVPSYSWSRNSKDPKRNKQLAGLMVHLLCQKLFYDVETAKKILLKADGLWAYHILRNIRPSAFGGYVIMKKLESNDRRVYSFLGRTVSTHYIINYLKKNKTMPKSKKDYLSYISKNFGSGKDLFDISSWASHSDLYRNSLRINRANAIDVAKFLGDNIEEISKQLKSTYQTNNLFDVFDRSISFLDKEEVLFFLNSGRASKVLKEKIMLKELL